MIKPSPIPNITHMDRSYETSIDLTGDVNLTATLVAIHNQHMEVDSNDGKNQ